MTDYLFDTPWWLLTVLFTIGALCLWTGFGRGAEQRDKIVGGIGFALLLAGAGLIVSSRLVETDREQVIRRSQELVKAVEARDWSMLASHLSAGATMSLPSNNSFAQNRDEIINRAKQYSTLLGGVTLKITRLEPKDVPGSAFMTEVSVYASSDKGTQLVVVEFTWQKDAAEWTANAIKVTQIGINPGGKP
jgi:hypothetical protein